MSSNEPERARLAAVDGETSTVVNTTEADVSRLCMCQRTQMNEGRGAVERFRPIAVTVTDSETSAVEDDVEVRSPQDNVAAGGYDTTTGEVPSNDPERPRLTAVDSETSTVGDITEAGVSRQCMCQRT